MKGVGWIVILLALLGVTYLLMRDTQTLRGEREGKAVLEPLQRSKEVSDAVQAARRQMAEGVDKAER